MNRQVFRPILILVSAVVLAAALQSCSKKDNPTTPPAPPASDTATLTPTPTATGYCGGAAGTCTFTDTPTFTNTFTHTFTPTHTFSPTDTATRTSTATFTHTASPTASNTSSATPTRTSTNTATTTPTATNTRTPSPTTTPTATFTFTGMCGADTHTCTPTPTSTHTSTTSPTLTPTPSFTPTNTPVFTFTWTPTPTATPTPTGNRIVIQYNFTGAAVNDTTNLQFISFSMNEDGPGRNTLASTASGTATIIGINPSNPDVIVIGVYNATGQDLSQPDQDPLPGDSFIVYNGACEMAGASPVTTGVTPITITMNFTRTGCRLYGFSGTLSYTGSGIQPNDQNRLYVELSSSADFSHPLESRGYESVPRSYSLFNNQQLSSTGNYYVRVWFDKNGNAWQSGEQPDSGDPCTILGPLASGLTPNTLNLALNGTENSCGIPTPTPTQTYANFLYGTASYASGPVDGTHPIVLRLFDNRNMNNQPVATTMVFTNGGSYVLPVNSAVTDYGLTMEYQASGPCAQCWYQVGNPLRYYDTGVSLPGTAVNILGPTNLNVSFDDTYKIYGYRGTLNYTGPDFGLGCNTGNPHLGIAAYNPLYPNSNVSTGGVCHNGDSYQLGMSSGTWNLRAFLDFNGNWMMDVGEIYEELGSYTANTGSPEYNFTFSGNCVWGPGCLAFTPTATPSSPTPTPTWTRTPTLSPTPTPTFTSIYRITGTLNYTGGSYTISPSTPLMIFVSPDFNEGTIVSVESNNSPFSVGVPSTGNYFLAAWVGPSAANNNPMVGRPYIAYDGTCDIGNANPINVAGPGNTNVGTIAFGNSCVFTGVYGNINYTGIGTVSESSPLRVLSFSDSGYTIPDDWDTRVNVNNSRYDIMIMGGSGTHYLRAFFDTNSNWQLDACEPFVNVGAYSAGGIVEQNITFDDTNRFNCTNYITGTASFTGGPVDASHPILIQTQPYGGGGGMNPTTSVVTNGGSYLVGAVSGNNTIAMFYKANGIIGNCNTCVGAGDYYEIYNNSSNFPGTPVNCSPSATVNLSFDTTWRMGGFVGTLTYTGTGAVECGNGSAIWVGTTNQSSHPVTWLYNWTSVCHNGYPYSLADWPHMSGAGYSYYLVAYYDVNANQQFDTGDKYDIFGPYTTDYGETPHHLVFSGTYTR